jgi:spore maturation protein CgeB
MRLKHPELETLSYEEALKKYFYDAYGWSDFWKINLEATGKFICSEVVMNAEFLQKKWAGEHNVRFNENNWGNDIILEQIKSFKPEVLFLVDQYNDNSISARIKKEVPSVKLILGWDGILWHKPETYENTDIILTCVKDSEEFYKKRGKTTYYYKFGFEPKILERLKKLETPYDTSFTGSLVPHPDYHLTRLHTVAELSRRVRLDIWAGSLPKQWHMLSLPRLKDAVRHRQWKFVRDIHRVGKYNKGQVFGLDMYNVLYNSKIVFNTHGDNSPKQAANMRMTEVTGAGALLLTDWKENLRDFFSPEEEIVTYKTVAEAADKIKMLLNNEKLRNEIAVRGHQRTIRDYSNRRRMLEFADFLYNYL